MTKRSLAGLVCASLLTGSLGTVWAATQHQAAPRQDGRLIQRLEWKAPPGGLPGTYADYLRWHPLRPAQFAGARSYQAAPAQLGDPGRGPAAISLLVDAALYPGITAELEAYVTDLTLEHYSVHLETVSGGTPAEIKAWVQQRYDAGSQGVVFIGDITAAWAEVSEDVFPSDLFYMDLDGQWTDADEDGDYESHLDGDGDVGPEVYVARLYAHTLGWDTEANMVNGYLAKARAYRDGSLTQPWRGLEYVDEDWYEMYVALDQVYGDEVTRYDSGYFTTGADYLDQMDLGQHFVQVCAHSYPGGHSFGRRPTESAVYAHLYVHSPTQRTARLLLGADDGIRVWVNGGMVTSIDKYGGWEADKYKIPVTLEEGWNRLLCKISQGGGGYQFSARFTDLDLETFDDLKYQINDPATHGEDAEFIRGWLLNGFHQDTADAFYSYLTTNYLGVTECTINPQEGEEMGGQTWTRFDGTGAFVDLGEYSGGADYGLCYAFARIYAEADVSCELWMGYDDGARVWLNTQHILFDNRFGDYTADMTRIPVNLKAGENTMVVKISEWMGSHGFSARFCQPDGSPVTGLSYDPENPPVTYLAAWLMNGPYYNPDQGTRLTHDYLDGETEVQPSEGDPAAGGAWQRALGDGCPFDIAAYYDHGDWVDSAAIQDRDPPVLFYNLFACGPGRFTEDDYLAGSYIFNTTWGLITVASAKSGSMLNFEDFTEPLGEGRTVGESFHEWFDAQAPFEQWEREWYYGMVLNGDPTLRPVKRGDLDRDGDIDLADHAGFADCLCGPGGSPDPDAPGLTPADCRRAFDFDGDEDVDLGDFGDLLRAFTG